MLKVDSITSYVLRIPRDFRAALGGAGSPSSLTQGTARYRSAASYATVYSGEIECLLVKVVAGEYIGWGEAQTPIAPEICHSILEHLAGPLLIGLDALQPEATYQSLYDAMRVRGHGGGFYLDALAAIDIALWDIRAKVANLPVASLLSDHPADRVPLYISGLPGVTTEERLQYAIEMASQGTPAFKIFWVDALDEGLSLVRQVRESLPDVDLYVDALWRLDPEQASFYAQQLSLLRVGWLEAPFMPEEIAAHSRLQRESTLPIAIGESYRGRSEFQRIFDEQAACVLQPDLGRCGIGTASWVARSAFERGLGFAPHVSISLGPQLAAAIHLSASSPALIRTEINPQILAVAQQFVTVPLQVSASHFVIPTLPGLGVSIAEDAIAPFVAARATIT